MVFTHCIEVFCSLVVTSLRQALGLDDRDRPVAAALFGRKPAGATIDRKLKGAAMSMCWAGRWAYDQRDLHSQCLSFRPKLIEDLTPATMQVRSCVIGHFSTK